jgi:Zn-dependent protease
MSFDQILFYISVYVPPLLFAITLHEAAHGYAAKYFGDTTAYVLGRVSLNPSKHVDPVGTILLPGLMILFGMPFVFGWAKPVPVSFGNLRRPKQDMVYVALAGPLANLVMAFAWGIFLAIIVNIGIQSEVLLSMGLVGVKFNCILMIFNLLPLPPLDGGRILVGLLPTNLSMSLARVEPYGMWIVIALLMLGGLDKFLASGVYHMTRIILSLVGL